MGIKKRYHDLQNRKGQNYLKITNHLGVEDQSLQHVFAKP